MDISYSPFFGFKVRSCESALVRINGASGNTAVEVVFGMQANCTHKLIGVFFTVYQSNIFISSLFTIATSAISFSQHPKSSSSQHSNLFFYSVLISITQVQHFDETADFPSRIDIILHE